MHSRVLATLAAVALSGTISTGHVAAADSDLVTFVADVTPGTSGAVAFKSRSCEYFDMEHQVVGCSLSGNASSLMLLCGYGTWDGTATLSSFPETESIAFHIDFVAGIGVAAGTTGDGSAMTGWVDITPTNCAGTLPLFELTGSLEL